MPSRKKAKGKARKAAKEAKAKARAKEGQDQEAVATTANQLHDPLEARIQRLQIIHASSMNCDHGLDSLSYDVEKICLDFIHAFIDVFISKDSVSVVDKFITAIQVTGEEFDEVYSSKLETVVSIILCSGTRCVLDGQDHYNDYARFYASLACHFEEMKAVWVCKSKAAPNWAKIIEMCGADDHTLVAYYRKRIPCPCLDKIYEEVKSVKKMGWCYNPNCSRPNQMTERSKMFCCARCGEVNYCSSECQKADWKRHKETCQRLAQRKAAFDSSEQQSRYSCSSSSTFM